MVTLTNNNEIYILPNLKDLFLQVAEDFIHRAIAAVENRGEFTVVLSGGNTPKLLLTTLVEAETKFHKIPWGKIKFFFGDERYVPLDNIESNYHMAYEYLFSKVPVLMDNIYRIPTEFSNPSLAAKEYERTLYSVFQLKKNQFPKFDLVYLGLGEDGHTASLMPGSRFKKHRLVVALWLKKTNKYRITLTPACINHAANVVFLVTGANKASAVREVLEGPLIPELYPAQLIHCLNSRTLWYLEKAAASKLSFLKDF